MTILGEHDFVEQFDHIAQGTKNETPLLSC